MMQIELFKNLTRLFLTALTALCALTCLGVSTAQSQEVVISGFPLGAGSVESPKIFEPYHSRLQELADIVANDPNSRIVVTGSADGEKYLKNDDAMNAGIALSRAHALRNFLVHKFGVDSLRVIVQSTDIEEIGEEYRYASARIEKISADNSDILARIDALENRPPTERVVVETPVQTEPVADGWLGVRLGIGFSSSPFGGIPFVSGGFTWKGKVYVEALAGHTFWNREHVYNGELLDTKRRLTAGHVVWYPFNNLRVGAVGGWSRYEQLATKYQEYVKLSEGPMFGVQALPLKYLSVTGTYNPSQHRFVEKSTADPKRGQFQLSARLLLNLGGGQ